MSWNSQIHLIFSSIDQSLQVIPLFGKTFSRLHGLVTDSFLLVTKLNICSENMNRTSSEPNARQSIVLMNDLEPERALG